MAKSFFYVKMKSLKAWWKVFPLCVGVKVKLGRVATLIVCVLI